MNRDRKGADVGRPPWAAPGPPARPAPPFHPSLWPANMGDSPEKPTAGSGAEAPRGLKPAVPGGRFSISIGGPKACLALALALALTASETPEKIFQAGQQAYAAEDYEKATSLFEQAIQAQPRTARYHNWYGKACGRRAERAVFFRAMGLARKVASSFEKAVDLDPDNTNFLNDLLDFYLAAPALVGGGSDKAPALAERLARISVPEGHRARALILAKKKDYEEAEREYRRALELEPDKAGRLLELAAFVAERGRYGEADALFDRAARLAPDSPEYLFTRGKKLAVAKRDPQQARELLERYLKSARKPDDPPPSEVEALLKKLE